MFDDISKNGAGLVVNFTAVYVRRILCIEANDNKTDQKMK